MTRFRCSRWLGVALLGALTGCGGTPQLGVDRDSFKAVDALYTAVSLRDERALERCATTLKGLGDARKLPEPASRSLEAIVEEAKGGGWDSARESLARFMRSQRR